MKVTVKIEFDNPFDAGNFLLKNKIPEEQQTLQQNNDNNNDSNEISIVIRDKEKKTQDAKEDLKRHGFNFYKYKKNSKIEDPRWTQTCTKSFWNSIKEQSVFDGLDIWTSGGGE